MKTKCESEILRSLYDGVQPNRGSLTPRNIISRALRDYRAGRISVQDLIWIGVSAGFIALSLLYVALADKA